MGVGSGPPATVVAWNPLHGSTRERFWVPMGWERRAPVMSAYDEFDRIRATGGATGVAITEQGVVRRL